ncbi:MAG: hypothetical protein ACLQUY_00920 [Ktedonobacterales bacterium]
MTHVRHGRSTLLVMTVIAVGLTLLGFSEISSRQTSVGLLAIIIGSMVYALAWTIALLDSLQARRPGWSLALILLLPLGVGPLLYSLIGFGGVGDHRSGESLGSIDVP